MLETVGNDPRESRGAPLALNMSRRPQKPFISCASLPQVAHQDRPLSRSYLTALQPPPPPPPLHPNPHVPHARRRQCSSEAMARVWMTLCLLPLARAFVAGPGLLLGSAVRSAPSDARVAVRGGVSVEYPEYWPEDCH